MDGSASALETAARHWSKRPSTGRRRWWSHPRILSHVNEVVCGRPLPGAWAGLNDRIGSFAGRPLGRGVSVGCGNGRKEIGLVAAGLVGSFDLYEISAERLDDARRVAESLGVADRVRLHRADAIETERSSFDLVYWNNALHHMLDVGRAVAWSRERLAPGGVFAMDDFVGADRFQWPDAQLEIANRVRAILPERVRESYLAEPNARLEVRRPDAARLIEVDPTEAAQSGRILDAVRATFPGCAVTLTGGVVYHLALNDVLAHFDDEADGALLDALLLLDRSLAEQGHTHYAVALARVSG